MNKFLASNLRKNFEPQEPNTEDLATVAMGMTKNANKQKAMKHLESERNFDSFSMIVNLLATCHIRSKKHTGALASFYDDIESNSPAVGPALNQKFTFSLFGHFNELVRLSNFLWH